MTQLRIASVNIERDNHLHRLAAFVKTHKPDVLCLQELCKKDIPEIEDLMGNQMHYAHMCTHPLAGIGGGSLGVGIIGWGALTDIEAIQYGSAKEKTSGFDLAEIGLFATYQGFRIGTTHVRVTHEGESTPDQRAAISKLIPIAQQQAEREGGLLLTGDFNAPRGRASFQLLADAFIDGVPAHYQTSIDSNLHKAGAIPFMVDGLFHTPSYQLKNAKLHQGVSDHCGLTCTLLRA